MSPEKLLKAAERVRVACEGETMQELIEALMRDNPLPPSNPYPAPVVYQTPDCGCPLYGICGNTACPRHVQVTYGVGFPE